MTTTAKVRRNISADDFAEDPHAAKYRGELERHPEAFLRLFALLNNHANEQRLVEAEMHGLPALAGVVGLIETDPVIKNVLTEGSSAFRFRQTVGVAVKLKMNKLGWCTTGRKGTVKGANHFTKAERYVADPAGSTDSATRALAAIDAVCDIGDDTEREKTGRELIEALSSTRRAEGRPF